MLTYLLVGALLAQRFRVFVLVPVLTLAALVAAVIGYHQGAGTWQLLGSSVLAIVCVQIGYLVGAGLNYFLAPILSHSALGRAFGASMSSRRAAN
jgi:membrane protein DedA with SNARE-associated domain